MKRNHRYVPYLVIAVLSLIFLMPTVSFAHCDTMDGPVVKSAQKALDTKNVNFVLIWVQKQDEAELRRAFQESLKVRRLSPNAKGLADKYFFETSVRLHRLGEGETYTGLKPAGTKIAPIVPVLDNAIETGSIKSLLTRFPTNAQNDIQERFSQVIARKNFGVNNVEAGREYIKLYVAFIHYVEHLYEESENESE